MGINDQEFKEKKLVIERLGLPLRSVENWEPYNNRNSWPELFDKIIEEDLMNRFTEKILLCNDIEADSISLDDYCTVLITGPAVLWNYLIEVLKTESEGG